MRIDFSGWDMTEYSETGMIGSGAITTKRLSKEDINALPLAYWQGPVHLIATAEEAAAVAQRCSREQLLGFDTETRPAFHKGQKFMPSLLQLATETEVFLVQVQASGMVGPLLDLLANPAITKAGVAPSFDLHSLQELAPFTPGGFVDLSTMARQRGLKNHGLRGLAALVCGIRISKSARTSNWANPHLTPQQIQYAATDAWISREIYLALKGRPTSKT